MKTRIQARLCMLALAVLAAVRGYAGTIYVTPDGAGSGVDWANATSLTNALRVNVSNDTIWLAQGTYSNNATFTVATNNITLYGGLTNGMATLAERNWTNYPAILSGNSNNWRVVTVSGANVTLNGLTISNSYGSTAGGIVKSSGGGSLTLDNCRIVNHTAYHGGGIYVTSGALLLTNSVVAGNRAWNAGGYDPISGYGLYASGATSVEIVDCLFSNQSFLGGFNTRDGYGGALWFNNGVLRVVRTDFIDNRKSPQAGGGAAYVGNTATLAFFSNCVFRGNSATDTSFPGSGGALWVAAGASYTVDVVNCTFTTNTAGSGGAIYLQTGTLNLKNSILWTNRLASGTSGSEIYQAGGTLRASYNTIAGGQVLPYFYRASGSASFSNCMTNNPLFASATDLHVLSPAGRWNGSTFVTTDTAYSPCIDASDPSDPVGLEQAENGNRRNLGAYGGTVQASMSPAPAAPLVANRAPETESYTRMILRGELTNASPVIATVGICYGTENIAGETTNGWQNVVQFYPPQQQGTVFAVMTSYLLTDTTYYYRTYATNAYGSSWGPVEWFTTGSEYPPYWGVGGGSNVIHIRSGAAGDADGRDWFNAYPTLYAGVSAVSSTRTNLWVAGGGYNEGRLITIVSNVTLIGGFAGTENTIVERALTNALGVVTNYAVINGENSHQCLSVTASGTVRLDAVMCTNAPSSASGALGKSGSGLLAMNNCRLVQNAAGQNGGGAYFSAGSVLMTNCVVADNKAAGAGTNEKGFGLLVQNTTLDMVDCLVSNNVPLNAWNSRDRYGGGIAFESGTLRALRTEFVGNRCADQAAGGAMAAFGNAAFSNCVFRGNQATTASSGVGMYVASGTYTVTVVNCSFAFNTNAVNGGAIYQSSGTLNLKNCILWTNRVTGSGSEIYMAGGTATVSYCDFTSTNSPYVVTNTYLVTWGSGVMATDPLFAGATDLHLKSKAGRWDPGTSAWVKDSVTSPCVDTGDPNDPVGLETSPNGRRINMGAYGGTAQASRTLLSGTLLMVR